MKDAQLDYAQYFTNIVVGLVFSQNYSRFSGMQRSFSSEERQF